MLIGASVALAESIRFPAAVATVTDSLTALADSGGVLIGGVLSDMLDRTRTARKSLLLSGAGITLAVVGGEQEFAGIFFGFAFAGAVFQNPVLTIVPNLMGDYYGTAHSSENYALRYTAKIWGALFGGTVMSCSWRRSAG